MAAEDATVVADFLRACGVTAVLAEAPRNRFAEPDTPLAASSPPAEAPQTRAAQPAAGPTAAPAPPPARRHAPPAPPEPDAPVALADEPAVADARALARAAPTLEALRSALDGFDGCPLRATARSTVHGEGPLGALLCLVGEAPGRDEDEAGRPFVGRSGQLLEKMLAAIGLTRAQVYITNVIPWRPPGNRTPSPIETATCEVFVRREIALVAPKIVVPLGGAAAKTLLRTDEGILRQRGRWTAYRHEDGSTADALPTLHPAYLLRTPAEKRLAWADLLALRARLEEAHGLPPLA